MHSEYIENQVERNFKEARKEVRKEEKEKERKKDKEGIYHSKYFILTYFILSKLLHSG